MSEPTKRPKYKIVPYDIMHDIHLLEQHVWWIFYRNVGVGPLKKLQDIIAEDAKTH